MARILVILMGLLLLSCVVCVGAGYFYFIPKAQDQVEDNLQEAVSTHVAPYFAGLDVTPGAGTYTLSAADVNKEIQSASLSLDNLRVEISPDVVSLDFGDQGREISYQADIEAVDGHFALVDGTLNGVPGWLLPENTISEAIEDSLNVYLDENGLVLTSVTLGQGEMTITTADA